MAVFRLTEELRFPHPSLADEDGLLAVGGDLDPHRLILAYQHGIFPWSSENQPLLWWSPSPRLVLSPRELHLSRSLRKAVRRGLYRVSLDEAFEAVIEACASTPRPDQDGTWITPDMQAAYIELHRLGVAHSVEAWSDGELVGGLYGVSLGRAFFGESMFARAPNASKVAFAVLVEQLREWQFELIDCQVVTEHLLRFGAREIELEAFLARLEAAVRKPGLRGVWQLDANLPRLRP